MLNRCSKILNCDTSQKIEKKRKVFSLHNRKKYLKKTYETFICIFRIIPGECSDEKNVFY